MMLWYIVKTAGLGRHRHENSITKLISRNPVSNDELHSGLRRFYLTDPFQAELKYCSLVSGAQYHLVPQWPKEEELRLHTPHLTDKKNTAWTIQTFRGVARGESLFCWSFLLSSPHPSPCCNMGDQSAILLLQGQNLFSPCLAKAFQLPRARLRADGLFKIELCTT